MLPKTNPLDEFLSEQRVWPREGDQPPQLFHFTGKVAADSICQDGIRCFNSNQMADTNEFQIGRTIMMQNPCDVSGYSWEELCADVEGEVRCWTFSMCNAKDNQTKRGMMQKHCCGKTGGPAVLSFDFLTIRNQVRECMVKDMEKLNEPIQRRCYHFFLPCLYATKHHGVILELKNYLFGQYFKKLQTAYKVKLNPRVIAFACSYIFRAMVKADQYKDEEEYRLVKITFDKSDDRSQFFGIAYRPSFERLPLSCPFCKTEDSVYNP